MKKTFLSDKTPIYCLIPSEAFILDDHIKGYLDHGISVKENDIIIDVGANAPGMKMSKGARKKLNLFIDEVDGFKSVKLISKKKAEFVMKDGSKKTIEF